MKTTHNSLLLTLSILILITLTSNIYAQDSPQWHLPDHAIARHGKGKIYQIKYSPDGTKMAVASGIGIWIYDVETTEELDLFSGHTSRVRSIDFSEDGTMIASGSQDNTVRVWDVATGMEIRTFTGHTDAVTSVTFNPNANMIASSSHDKTARLWDLSTGTEQYTFTAHTKALTSVAFNDDGTQLATTGFDNIIRIWDVNTYNEIRTLTGHEKGVYSIDFSPDGTKLVSGGLDKKVHVWDVSTGHKLRTFEGHTSHINSVAFTPNGLLIGSGSHDKTIRIWGVNSGEERYTIDEQLSWVNSIAFSPDGKTLASADVEGTIRIWQGYTTITSRQIRTFTRHQTNWDTILFNQDRKTLAVKAVANIIQLWDVETNNHLHTFIGHTDSVNSIDISPDERFLVSGADDGTMRLWDVETGTQLHTLTKFIGYNIISVEFSPDGKLVAGLMNFMNSNIVLYDVKTGLLVRNITAFKLPPLGAPWSFKPREHSYPVNKIAFSPKGDVIASCSSDETVRLWDVNIGAHLRVMTGHTDTVYNISFSPDGKIVTSVSHDDTVRLWDVATGSEIRQFNSQSDGVSSVYFSPDGNTIASGGNDNMIRFWDFQTGNLLHILTGHKGSVLKLTFSPDGQTLASNSSDGTILIWNITNLIPSSTLVSLSPSSVESPGVGEQLTFTLNISGGQNVAGYQTKVHFDTTALRYVGSANGDYLTTNSFFVQPVVDVNNVQIAAVAYGEEIDGDGTLATITFEVVEVKSSTVRLSNTLLTNSTGIPDVPQTIIAEITEPPARPEDVNEDGVVDVSDLVLVANNFGKHGDNAADVNGDGVVNIIDLALVAAAIGNGDAAPVLWSANSNDMPTRASVEAWLRKARQLNLQDLTFQRGITVLEQLLASLTPEQTALLPNYPNPFNPETWIPYQLSSPADVRITIYSANGQLIRQLDLGFQEVGIYQHRSQAAYWDGKNQHGEAVASGIYFYALNAGKFNTTRKMLIQK